MKKAILWGAISTGEVLCPVIYLWRTREGIAKARNVGGALEHGTEVMVQEIDDDWVKVYKNVVFEGKNYPQVGYVRRTLVRIEDEDDKVNP